MAKKRQKYTKRVCIHGTTEPREDNGGPWCMECEIAPYQSDPDVKALVERLQKFHKIYDSDETGYMCRVAAAEICSRRREERRSQRDRGTLLHVLNLLDTPVPTMGQEGFDTLLKNVQRSLRIVKARMAESLRQMHGDEQ